MPNGVMADSTLRAATVCYDMQTTAVGDRRSRVPSCGRRYADAPAAVPLTARGGGEFPPSSARQCPPMRTRTGLRFIRRFLPRAPTVAGADVQRDKVAFDASSCRQTTLSMAAGSRDRHFFRSHLAIPLTLHHEENK